MSSIDYILTEFSAFVALIIEGGAVVGIFLTGIGIYGFYKQTESPQNFPFGRNVSTFITGTLLIISGTLYQAMDNTIDLRDTNQIKDISVGTLYLDKSALSDIVENGISVSSGGIGSSQLIPPKSAALVIGFMYLIGVGAFTKGIYLIKDAGDIANPQGKTPVKSAIIFMVAGYISMNINDFGCLVGNTFGTTLFCAP